MKKVIFFQLVIIALCGIMNVSYSEEGSKVTKNEVAVKAGKKALRIGVTMPTADHGWTGGQLWWAKRAIEDWKAKDPDLTFILKPAADPTSQVSVVEDLMVQNIDALVILPHDSAPLTPVVEEAHKAGIYVVAVDRGLTKPVYDVYITGDNPGLGRVSAQFMAKEMGGKGKMVMLEGIPCVVNKERVVAFEEVISQYPGIEILESQPAYWSTQKGLEIMENYLQKYDHIDAVFAQDDDVLKGVLQAYKESGRNDIKLFLGGAGSKDIIKMIMDGDPLVRGDVTYPCSSTASAISLAVMGARGEQIDGFYQNSLPVNILLSYELVTRENASDYYEPDSIY